MVEETAADVPAAEELETTTVVPPEDEPHGDQLIPAVFLVPVWESGEALPECPANLNETGVFATGFSLGDSFTLCARVRGTEGQRGEGLILSQGKPPTGWQFAAPSASGGVTFDHGGEAGEEGSAVDVAAPRVDDGDWHHAAVTLNKGVLRVFVDGKETCVCVSRPEPATEPGADLVLGTAESGGAEGLKDVQVYSWALCARQVADVASGSRLLPTGVELPLRPRDVDEIWMLQKRATRNSEDHGLQSAARPTEARAALSKALDHGKDPLREFQEDVMCNLLLDLLEHARSICLTAKKTAVFAGILGTVVAAMYGRSATTVNVGEPLTASECFLEYKRLLLAHSGAPAGDSDIFRASEAKLITDFVASGLFQHYALYQCCLVNPRCSIMHQAEAALERPRPPPDLRQAKLRQDKSRRKSGKVQASSFQTSNTMTSDYCESQSAYPETAASRQTPATPVADMPQTPEPEEELDEDEKIERAAAEALLEGEQSVAVHNQKVGLGP